MEAEVEIWFRIARDFGIPVAVLVAFALAVWVVMRWIGREIVVPLRDKILTRLVTTFDKMDSTMDTLTVNVQSVSHHMESQTRALERIEKQGEQRLASIGDRTPRRQPRDPSE